jgi:hypothetical protein
MIGRDQVSEKPAIMFFCEDKEPRKRSKKIVNEGGLLRRLPGFRTGHRANQPGIGLLVQPATDYDSIHNEVNPIEHTDVYYDPVNGVPVIGMPVFVKQRDGRWQQASASTLSKGNQCILISVAHLFFENTRQCLETGAEDDSDFDFGSDIDSELGEGEHESQRKSPNKKGVLNDEFVVHDVVHDTFESYSGYFR